MCRMIFALGNINPNQLIDQLILMAKDQTEIHEYNRKSGKGTFKHKEGWGIAYLNKNNNWVVKKSVTPIYDDLSIDKLRNIKTKLMILHVRKATKGIVSLNNCHPFEKDEFVFFHNGTVNDKIEDIDHSELKGNTDSERVFHSLLNDLKNTNYSENIQTIKTIIRKKINSYHDYSAINFILSNKSETFICNYYKKNPEYFKMNIARKRDSLIISSEIFETFSGHKWEKMKNGKLITIDHKKILEMLKIS
jgi:predicted glutamine amidotransferase